MKSKYVDYFENVKVVEHALKDKFITHDNFKRYFSILTYERNIARKIKISEIDINEKLYLMKLIVKINEIERKLLMKLNRKNKIMNN